MAGLSISCRMWYIDGRQGISKSEWPKRNVDILLALPRSQEAKGLLATDDYLKLHPTSGAWMMIAGLGSSKV